MVKDAYQPLYLRGIDLFNRCSFFTCHEVWEELWIKETGPARQYFKGLIQAAVALHHLGKGNLHGARKLAASSRGYLDPYRPTYLGLDVDQFLDDFARYVDEVLDSPAGRTAPPLETKPIPKIRLQRCISNKDRVS